MGSNIDGLIITGASDDLIEIEGEFQEEFNCYNCTNGTMTFSDGTLLRVYYDEDGIWRFKPICKGDLLEKIECGSVQEDTNDKVYFKNGLLWCTLSKNTQIGGIKNE